MAPHIQLSWQQIQTFTSASIRSRYRNTAAGMLWVVLSPLFMFGAQAYAFKYVLKLNVEHYPLFLVTGVIPWIFLTSSLSMGTTMIVSQARLLKSFPIHPLVCLVALVFDNFINFIIIFILLLVPLLIFSENGAAANFIYLPLPLISLLIAIVGLTWLASVMQVFFYDTKFIIDFLIGIAFFLTPIFYPADFVDPAFRWLVIYNPLSILFSPIQALSKSELPPDYVLQIIRSFGVSIGILCTAIMFWNRKKNLLYFKL